MTVRTLLATTTVAGVLLAGTPGAPASADNGPVPERSSGHLVAWGTAAASAQTTVPATLDGEQIVDVSASDNATGVVTADGRLVVWGTETADEANWAPTALADVTDVSLAAKNGMALTGDGTVTAWGSTVGVDAVPGGLTAKAIAMSGSGTAYAVRTDGTLISWGAAHTPMNPAPPSGLSDLVDVDAAGLQTLALDAAGNVSVWCPDFAVPMMTPPAEIQGHVEQIATGGPVNGAILDDGSIRLWGIGAPAVPAELAGERVVALDVNSNVIAATEDGDVYAWGPTADLTALPAGVAGEPVAAVAVAQFHAAVIVTDFRVTTPPSVTGQPKVGQMLTATPAELSLEPDAPATGQWLADGEPIDGQTGTTLTLDDTVLGKTISYRTSATRGEETVESTSTEVGPVTPTVVSTTDVAIQPTTSGYGAARNAVATVTATGGTPTGTVTFTLGSTEVTKPVTAGKATWALPRTLAVGRHEVTAAYEGDSAIDPSTSTPANVTVTKAASTVTAASTYLKRAKKAVIKAAVCATTGAAVSGTVKFVLKRGKKTVAVKKDTLNGRDLAKVTFQGRAVRRAGAYKVVATYLGSAQIKASKDVVGFRVRR